MTYDTKEGLKVGYNGKLYFDNGILGFEIANLGGNFQAVPKAGSKLGNVTNGSVDYTGSIQVAQGGHTANVAVTGTAGLKARYGVNDNQTAGGYEAVLTNRNQWNVTADGFAASGTHGGNVLAAGGACRNGSVIHARHGLRGGAQTAGIYNDTPFSVAKWGEAGVKKVIWVNDQDKHMFLGHEVPSVAIDGEAGFKRGSAGVWNGNQARTGTEGGGIFSALVWADTNNDSGTATHNVHVLKSGDYGYKGFTAVNEDLTALFGGVGTINKAGGVQVNHTKGTGQVTVAAGELGDLRNVGIVKRNPQAGDREKFEKELEDLKGMDTSDFAAMEIANSAENGNGTVKTAVHAQWAAGKGVEVTHNDDGTVDVATRAGVKWRAIGVDSKTKKPWNAHGARGYNSTFEYDPNNSAIKNIELHIGNDTKIVDIIQKKLDNTKHMKKLW